MPSLPAWREVLTLFWSSMNHFFKTHHLPRRLLHVLIPGLILFTGLVTTLSLLSCVLLLVFDLFQPFLHFLAHAPVSAAPLLLIGLASLSFQLIIRPNLLDFLKSLIVSSAFILWGVDQLLPAGRVATMLGDVVIVLYIVDLGWMMIEHLTHQGWLKQTPLEDIAHSVQALPPAPVIWAGAERGKAAITAVSVHLSAPEPQPLRKVSTIVRTRNTSPIKPIRLRAFEDSSGEDTSSNQVCSGCDGPKEHYWC